LGRGRYLPVEVPAVDIYGKGVHLYLPTGIKFYIKLHHGELEFDTLELEVLCGVYKLQETWDGGCELVVEDNIKLLEARGDDPMKNYFRVCTSPRENKSAKIRKCDWCHDRRMRELPLYITVGNSKIKAEQEHL
jgi:hypothetical protein